MNVKNKAQMKTESTTPSPKVGSSAIVRLSLCPVCGEKTQPKGYGPFFTPEPVMRVAMTCPKHHWRGRMCATREEAKGHNDGSQRRDTAATDDRKTKQA